jgi:tRNA(Ile)-lysidine synthase
MWNNLEHLVWNKLKLYHLENDEIYLLALSGGLDSMVLLHVMKKLKPKSRFILMHYHHGPGDNLLYRNACLELVKNNQSNLIILESDQSLIELQSEAEFRKARLIFFEKIKAKYDVSYYLTAHHLDDVLETRLIKLIRGTGLAGLEGFELWNAKILRPFFEVNKTTLHTYAMERKVQWIDDPTNKENNYLRNWIRNIWLPQLDEKMPGACKNIAQSLQNILNESGFDLDLHTEESPRYITRKDQFVCIDKVWFFSFNTKDQLSLLIRVIKESFQCDFSTSQIKEVIRRLDKNQNELTFQVASINWIINNETIMLAYMK